MAGRNRPGGDAWPPRKMPRPRLPATRVKARPTTGVCPRCGVLRPEPFADRVWNLFFLAVHPGRHRSGIGDLVVPQVGKSLRGSGE